MCSTFRSNFGIIRGVLLVDAELVLNRGNDELVENGCDI